MEWNRDALRSLNIEDRRYVDGRGPNTHAAPREADSLVRGLPQTPAEVRRYKEKLREDEYYDRYDAPMPYATANGRLTPTDLLGRRIVRAEPSEGDPAGIDAHRLMRERLQRLGGPGDRGPMPQPAPAIDPRLLDQEYLQWLASQRRPR